GELGDLPRVDAVGCLEVEAVERLGLGEARVPEPAAHGRVGSRRLLCGEHLVQVVLVGPLLFTRLPAESLEAATEARHLEAARLSLEQVGHHHLAAHAAPRSNSSKSAAAAVATSMSRSPC